MKKLLGLLSVIMVGGSATTTIVGCSDHQASTKINIAEKITNPLELGTIKTPTSKEFLNALQKEIATIKDLSTITTKDYDVYKAHSTQFITDQDVKNSDTLQIKIVSEGNKFKGNKDNITANYTQKDTRTELSTIIKSTDLGVIAMVGQEPTKSELLASIKAKNPSTADNLTEADFAFKGSSTSTNATIVGENNYRGQVDLNYTKQAVITFQATIYVDEQGKEITSNEHDLSEVKSTTIKQIGFYKKGEAIQVVRMPKTVEEVPKQLPKEITSLSHMFDSAENFNQDISKWDVSNVTNMFSMFNLAWNFNQDISKWDVSNVTDMSYMFNQATNFNQDISKWDVSKVTDMSDMFAYAKNFNQDISKWDVSKVTKHYSFSSNSWLEDKFLPNWAN